MRFDHHSILQNFQFLKESIQALDESYFPYRTRDEIVEEKNILVEECKMDHAFKLLTLLEYEIRNDFEFSIASKYRDDLSKIYSETCDEFRRGRSDYSRSRLQECRRIHLDDLFSAVSRFFKKQQDLFHQRFSLAKGHFNVFRHWYAHGRKGRQNPPLIPDPEDLFDILEEFSYKVLFRSRKSL